MSRTLLINVADDEERRAALLENDRLSLLWVERTDDHSYVGNIYKGRVVRLEPSIGAAFVEVGLERAGFLHVADVRHPDTEGERGERGEPRTNGRREARIDEVLQRGQEIVVQVARDPIANKGATLTTYLSLPGRTLVLFPGLGRIAVSRKIEDEAVRDRLRTTLESFDLPPDVGVVARTASADAPDDELRTEMESVLADHAALREAVQRASAPALVHRAADFASRAVQELLVRSPDGAGGPTRVVADTPDSVDRARAAVVDAHERPSVELHDGPEPLFHAHGIESEVRHLASTRVALNGGASLVIQETEALWAIDVNSGKRRRGANLEATALETGLLAAAEVARQIRLRDLAGLIIVDFIDCREPENRAQVEAAVRQELARDPARMRVAAMSEFMVLEITRKRTRAGAGRAGSLRCPSCGGVGRVRSAASAGLAALRDARAALARGKPSRLEIVCSPSVADDLERREGDLAALEAAHGVEIDVVEEPGIGPDQFHVHLV